MNFWHIDVKNAEFVFSSTKAYIAFFNLAAIRKVKR